MKSTQKCDMLTVYFIRDLSSEIFDIALPDMNMVLDNMELQ